MMDDINLYRLNEKLAQILENNGIKNLKLTSLGNSIASGYSAYRETKPILYRNDSLKLVMQVHDIHVETYHFARAQNNSDDKIFNWVDSNITLGEIYKMNRSDYSNNGFTSMTTTIKKEQIDKYYSEDKGVKIQDVIFDSNINSSNIIIYNGLTGSFLDNITRNGKHKLTYGIKKDQIGLESTLKLIQDRNRKSHTNTQVYLCGAPDFLGIHISEFINRRLKKVAKKYANAVYVKPVETKLFYDSLNQTGKKVDIHYDEEEYLEMLNHIFESISENYEFLKAKINLDRSLCEANSLIELEFSSLVNNPNLLQRLIHEIIEEDCKDILNSSHKIKYLQNIKKFILEVFPYDYFYLGKNNIVKEIAYQKKR